MLAGVGGTISATALFATAIIAAKTFREWKQKEAFSENRSLAIEILKAASEAFYVISDIRFPTPRKDEEEAINNLLDERTFLPHLRTQELIRAQVRYRHDLHSDYWRNLGYLSKISEFVFGENVADRIRDILRIRLEILNAAEDFARDVGTENYAKLLTTLTGGWTMQIESSKDEYDLRLRQIFSSLKIELLEYTRYKK